MTLNLNLPPNNSQSPTLSSTETEIGSAPSTAGRIPPDEYTHGEFENQPDVENDLNRPVQGYPELAKLIVDYPDFEAFQSFKDLSIKSLLYYQAELDKLRKDLHKLEWRDFQNEPFPDAKKCCVRASTILLGKDSENVNARKQYNLIKRIREVLKDYHEELLRYSQITALPEADSFNVNSLRTWLSKPDLEEQIQGPGSKSWEALDSEATPQRNSLWSRTWGIIRSPFWTPTPEKSKFDLVVPRAGTKVDGLARWVANEFVPYYQYLKDRKEDLKQASVDEESGTDKVKEKERLASSAKGKRTFGVFPSFKPKSSAQKPADPEKPTITSYREGPMLRFTSFIATIVACLLPTVAIAVLAQLHTIGELLGIIAVFTAVFAGGLMMLVDSGTSRVEIFTATAAFSAVMVVFVQNQNGGANTPGGTSLALNGTHV